jgi:hypothetical protein
LNQIEGAVAPAFESVKSLFEQTSALCMRKTPNYVFITKVKKQLIYGLRLKTRKILMLILWLMFSAAVKVLKR